MEDTILDTEKDRFISVDKNKMRLKIVLPVILKDDARQKMEAYYKTGEYSAYYIKKAGIRGICFYGKISCDGLEICDFPSSITASYSIVNSILSLNSDESFDTSAQKRYLIKEMDMFEYALQKCMEDLYINEKMRLIEDLDKMHFIKETLKKIEIIRADF